MTLFLSIAHNGQAAIKLKKINTIKLEKKIEQQDTILQNIKKEIFDTEAQLSAGSSRYEHLQKRKNSIENRIYKLGQALKKQQVKLEKEHRHFQEIFKITLLESLDSEKSAEKLLSKKILLKALSEKLKINSLLKAKNSDDQSVLVQLQSEFKDIVSLELELVEVLNNMEYRKKEVVSNYLHESKEKDRYTSELGKLRLNLHEIKKKKQRMAKKLISMSFSSPLRQFEKIDYGKKGITFSFKDISYLYATQSGKIVYTGTLSTYGNVVMIDHGKEVKTVILGDFLVQVKKGKVVKQGDIIGQTQAFQKKAGNVYFEVRRKNKVQNTILLMDRKFSGNHNLDKKRS